jgi:thiamine-monophosphate kinase
VGDTRTVGGFGEFRLIERIREKARPPRAPEIGIGDDAAVLLLSAGQVLLTTDAFVDGIHFDPAIANWYQIGARMVTAAVSDVAAMGGTPRHVVICLCIPPEFLLSAFDTLTDGMIASAEKYGAVLVGGDTVRTAGPLVVAVSVTGFLGAGPVLRSGATAGDVLAVTGRIGGCDAGLAVLRDASFAEEFPEFGLRHLEPVARVKEGELLASSGLVSSMIDISDGLAAEIHHLAEASDTGFVVDAARIPLFEGLRKVAGRLGKDPLEIALGSGEEFELLFTLTAKDQQEMDRLFDYLAERTGIQITAIGEVRPKSEGIVLLRPDGHREPLPAKGYQHF